MTGSADTRGLFQAGRPFPTVDDLLAGFRRLARAHRGQAALFSYGRSRQGESLLALRLGEGPIRILAYAFPQPDEPLGGVALLHLAERLLEEPGRLREATWTLLPCVDPDGARRNEGWFTEPLDLGNYARRAFRPAEGEQVEWSFPSDDPAWPWERVLPETRALQSLLDEAVPDILFPLHNALLGGAYAFLSAEAAPLAGRLRPVWEGHGLPTHRGEPELPFAEVLAPGVFRLPSLGEVAAALSSQGIADPAGLLGCGAPAYLYLRRRRKVWVVVPELPLFALAETGDTRPAGVTRREVLQEALDGDRAAYAEWSALYAQAVPFLEAGNPYRGALEAHRRSAPELMGATARWVIRDDGLARPATVAEVVDGRQVIPYLRCLHLGTLCQALAAGGRRRRESRALLERIRARLDEALAGALAGLEAAPVPWPTLVQTVEEIVGLTATGFRESVVGGRGR